MSEQYNQVDLHIGTDAQFETNKASLPVGAIWGSTDGIKMNDLDSALQQKIDGQFELIEDITLSEDTNTIDRTWTTGYSKVFVVIEQSTTQTSANSVQVYPNNYTTWGCASSFQVLNEKSFGRYMFKIENGLFYNWFAKSKLSTDIKGIDTRNIYTFNVSSITRITINAYSGADISSGTNIKIYGVRA